MTGKENPVTVKRRNAQPARSKLRSLQGTMWWDKNPDLKKASRQKSYEKHNALVGRLLKAIDPITITSNNIILTSDWHIPFHDEILVEKVFSVAKENDTKDIAIIGDFWDSLNISHFVNRSDSNSPAKITFKGEKDTTKGVFKRVLNVFDQLYICDGNHEDRLSTLTGAAQGIKDLFEAIRPGITDREWERRVRITLDNFMELNHCGEEWLLCHPKSFRKTNLSVVKELATIEHKSVFGGHGHQWAQGRDPSGKYRVVDGGGLFYRPALEYARSISCHAKMRSGFYLLKDGELTPFEGDEA